MGKKARLQLNSTKADANTHFTAAYVREMAHELAELARSAGYARLSAFLTLASVEAETHPPVFPLTSDPDTIVKKADIPSARASAGILAKAAR
jgi:hypothetical protein